MMYTYEWIGVGMLLIPFLLQMIVTYKRTPKTRKLYRWIFSILGVFEIEGILIAQNMIKLIYLSTFILLLGYIVCILAIVDVFFILIVARDVRSGRLKGVVVDEEKKRYFMRVNVVLLISGALQIGLYYLLNAVM